MGKYILALVVVGIMGTAVFMYQKKSMPRISKGLILFPYWCKPLGILLALMAFVLNSFFELPDEQMWKAIAENSINIGLFLFCFSRDRNEDELSNSVRLKVFYTSVVAGFVFFILLQSGNLLLGDIDYVFPARQLITIVLLIYAFRYTTVKRKVFFGR